VGIVADGKGYPHLAGLTGGYAIAYAGKLYTHDLVGIVSAFVFHDRRIRRVVSWLVVSVALVMILLVCSAPPLVNEQTEAVDPGDIEPTEAGGVAPVESQVLPTFAVLPTQAPPPTPLPLIPEQRLLVVEWPPVIRTGDTDVILLKLAVDQEGNITPTAQFGEHEVQGETVYIPNLYDTHNVVAEARLDLAGMQVVPPDEVIEPMRPGQTVTFSWSVRPESVGDYRGMLWVHLRFVPLDGGEETRRPLTAQVIEIRAVNMLGMGGTAARLAGWVGTVLGSILGLDNIVSWIWKFLRRGNA